jgi:hypothetical protein
MALVTLDQVNRALNLGLFDGDERTADVELKIAQAEDAVLDFLKKPEPDWTPETVPPRVTAAIMLVIQSLYDDSATPELLSGLGSGDPRNPVVALLYRLRDPTLA